MITGNDVFRYAMKADSLIVGARGSEVYAQRDMLALGGIGTHKTVIANAGIPLKKLVAA